MENLSATYNRNAVAQDKAELDQWLAQPTEAPAPAKPEEPKKAEKPSALMKGVQATGEAITGGATKIQNVLTNGPTHGTGPLAYAKEILDGLIGVATSPAAGVGAGTQQAFENLSPEQAAKVILPGGAGGMAKLVRAMLGQPAFSPKQTAEERTANEAPMTAGELANIASSLATMVYGPKVLKKALGEKPGTTAVPQVPEPAERAPQPPPLALEAGSPPKMLEAGTPEQGVRVGQAIPLGESSLTVPLEERRLLPPGEPPKMLGGDVYSEKLPTAIEAGARRYGMQGHEFVADALHAIEQDFAEIMGGKDIDGPLSTAGEVATEKTADWNKAPSALDKAMNRARDLLEDEGGYADPALLARISVGAALGCATADDAEGCAKRALLGAGLAAPLSAQMAKAVAARLKGMPETVGEQQAKAQKSGVAVQAGEQPYQPNYARLDMTPAVKNLMVNVHRSLKDDILERRGPAKTNDATVKEALRRIETEKFTAERVLTLGDEEVLSAEDITAARILSKRAFEQAIETRDLMLGGGTVPEGTLKQQLALAGAMGRNTRVAQTRQAQALQANRITIGQEKVAYRPEDVAHLAEEIMPDMTDQQLAMQFSTIKTPEQMGKAATFMSVFPRAATQALYFAYLSGKTAAKNLVGNASMIGMQAADTGLGYYMPTWDYKWVPDVIRKVNHPSVGPVMAGEATAGVRALGESLVDHVRMLKHNDLLDAEAVKLGFADSVKKSESRAPAMRELADVLGAQEGSTMASVGDWADKITTFSGTVLDRTDAHSKTLGGRVRLQYEALHQAAKEGLAMGSAPFEARVGELVNDPTQLTSSARQRVTLAGERGTFTREFEGRIMQALAAGPENQWLNLVYRSMVMPFFRVTAWMTEEGMTRTPGLNFLTKDFYADWRDSIAERQRAQARIAGGAAIIGSFMYLESQGLLTGTAPKDPKARKIWEDAGYQERSWRFPGGTTVHSYDGLGPITNLISTAADLSMAARRLPSGDAAHLMGSYMMSVLNNLDSRTFTQTISNLMDVIKNPSSDSQVEKAMDFVRKQVAGWAKPGVAREIEAAVDPARRRPVRSGAYEENSLGGSIGREFQMLFDDVRSGWPYFSSAKDSEGHDYVPVDRDSLTGEPTIVAFWPFLPFQPKTLKELPFERPETMPKNYSADVRHELLRLNGAGLQRLPDWVGGSNPGAGSGFGPSNTREGVRLTGQAKEHWELLMTQGVKNDAGETYAKALASTMSSPLYWLQSDGLRGTDGGKAVMIQAVEREFRERATEQLYRDVRGLRQRVTERQAERELQKVPTQQQPDARNAIQNLLKSLGQ